MSNPYFKAQGMSFLRHNEKNNNRDWFHENKSGYESLILTPALNRIDNMEGVIRLCTYS